MKPQAWLLALALALVGAVAGATTVRALSLEAMTREADLIIQGRVVAQRAFTEGPRGWIYTASDVEVIDALKGAAKPGDRLQVRQLGGALGDREAVVAGNASLSQGEEVILFLDRDEDGVRHYIVGLAQGKYSVDRRSPQPVVRRDAEAAGAAQGQAHKALGAPVEVTQAPPAEVGLESFKRHLRALLTSP
jgi:hypothetical protein